MLHQNHNRGVYSLVQGIEALCTEPSARRCAGRIPRRRRCVTPHSDNAAPGCDAVRARRRKLSRSLRGVGGPTEAEPVWSESIEPESPGVFGSHRKISTNEQKTVLRWMGRASLMGFESPPGAFGSHCPAWRGANGALEAGPAGSRTGGVMQRHTMAHI